MTYPTLDQINTVYEVYAVCIIILYIKYFIVVVASASPTNHPAEDGMGEKPEPVDLKRKERSLANDMESLPMQLIVFFSSLFFTNMRIYGDSSGSIQALSYLMIIYTISRIAYSFCYAYSIQPFRSICWAISVLVTICAGIVGVWSSFQR